MKENIRESLVDKLPLKSVIMSYPSISSTILIVFFTIYLPDIFVIILFFSVIILLLLKAFFIINASPMPLLI